MAVHLSACCDSRWTERYRPDSPSARERTEGDVETGSPAIAVLVYRKHGQEPTAHTIPNVPVDDMEAAVEEFLNADIIELAHDEGRLCSRDPAGDILSAIQE